MTFIDYSFTVIDNQDIIFDVDLTPAKLGFEEGDRFELTTVDGVVVFKKLNKNSPAEKDPEDFWYKRKDDGTNIK